MSNAADAAAQPPAPAAVTLQQASALHSVLPPIRRAFRREPAIAVTLGYVFVALAGIFYNYSFYRHFDIPILTLSQITDFLTAGLQHPIALLLVLSTFPIIWLFDQFNQHARRKHAELRQRLATAPPSIRTYLRVRLFFTPPHWFTTLSYLGVIFGYGWVFVTVYADYSVEQVLAGRAPQVRVQMSSDPAGIATLEHDVRWSYLGAVANYVFVYDRASQRALILPVNNIVRIEPVIPSQAENEPAKIDSDSQAAP